ASPSGGGRRRAHPGAAHLGRADQPAAPPLAGLAPARDATARTRHEVDPPRDPRPPVPSTIRERPIDADDRRRSGPRRCPRDLRAGPREFGDDASSGRPDDRDRGGPCDPRRSRGRITARPPWSRRGIAVPSGVPEPLAEGRDVAREGLRTVRRLWRRPDDPATRAERLGLPGLFGVSGLQASNAPERTRPTPPVGASRGRDDSDRHASYRVTVRGIRSL